MLVRFNSLNHKIFVGDKMQRVAVLIADVLKSHSFREISPKPRPHFGPATLSQGQATRPTEQNPPPPVPGFFIEGDSVVVTWSHDEGFKQFGRAFADMSFISEFTIEIQK